MLSGKLELDAASPLKKLLAGTATFPTTNASAFSAVP